MSIKYRNIERIEGPLIFLKANHSVMNGEKILIKTPTGEIRNGKVLEINENIVCVQVFQGTKGLNVNNTEVTFLDQLFTVKISRDMLGKTFDGQGKLKVMNEEEKIHDLIPETVKNITGSPINPNAREYPKDLIQTGISVIDGLNTLVRGQKLPIFTGQGLTHNKLAAQIVKQSKVITNEPFIIIFVGIGILLDDALFFQQSFKESGNFQNVISFLNLANDPTIERMLVPRVALTTAEYFAFELGMHVLLVMTDMTNYCEALRELSGAKEEIPGRKGFPGYLYSDLASIYERAGRIKGIKGSITQIPIISMPNDDITHPIPDLTGYITEGQIVLSRDLHKKGIYPPVEILSSVSRLMKDGIGKGKTREDHMDVVSQLFEFYSKSLDIKELESIIGAESLTDFDRKILKFGKDFELYFINQSFHDERSIDEFMNIAWGLLSSIPKKSLLRINREYLEKYYIDDSRLRTLDLEGIF
ncbi:MAG: V-type ATP synthase subunit B [archaeon]|nr:V-type ATP synthase subunit B [archaeon]